MHAAIQSNRPNPTLFNPKLHFIWFFPGSHSIVSLFIAIMYVIRILSNPTYLLAPNTFGLGEVDCISYETSLIVIHPGEKGPCPRNFHTANIEICHKHSYVMCSFWNRQSIPQVLFRFRSCLVERTSVECSYSPALWVDLALSVPIRRRRESSWSWLMPNMEKLTPRRAATTADLKMRSSPVSRNNRDWPCATSSGTTLIMVTPWRENDRLIVLTAWEIAEAMMARSITNASTAKQIYAMQETRK